MDAGARLIIVCGLPGSGKTTLAQRLECKLRAIRLCPDDWLQALSLDLHDEACRDRLENLQWTFAQQLLARGVPVIIEWGTWGRHERDRLRLRARDLGAAVELHYLSAPDSVLWDRIQRRGLEVPPITREALAQWSRSFEVPSAAEMTLFDAPLSSGEA